VFPTCFQDVYIVFTMCFHARRTLSCASTLMAPGAPSAHKASAAAFCPYLAA
jgi:hypothetical protein